VVRCFEDNDIIHVNGKVDPKSDIDVINLELIFCDLDQVHSEPFSSYSCITLILSLISVSCSMSSSFLELCTCVNTPCLVFRILFS